MRYRFIALALCLLMVSACAVTGAVSAKPATKSNTVVQYRVFLWDETNVKPTDTVVGSLKLNLNSGQWILNAKTGAARICELRFATHTDAGWGYTDINVPGGSVQASKSGDVHASGLLEPTFLLPQIKSIVTTGTEGVDYAWALYVYEYQ